MDVLERSALAKELLESRVFREVHTEIRDEIVKSLETVAFDDIDKQHELVIALQIHNRHKTKLERWVDDGKIEQKALDDQNWIEKARQKLRRA